MTMVPPVQQFHVSLAHVESVLKACGASLTSALCGMCYYTTEQGRYTATRALSEVCMDRRDSTFSNSLANACLAIHNQVIVVECPYILNFQ